METGAVGYLVVAQYMAAAACSTLALGHFLVWAQRRGETASLWFALSALFAGGNAVAEAIFYRATTVATFNGAFKWANTANVFALVALLWFFSSYTGTARRWRAVKWGVTAVFVGAGLLNLVLPYGFLFREITELRFVTLPWGEVVALADGVASPWRVLTDVAFVGTIGLTVDGIRVLWQQKRDRGALFVGGAFLLYLVLLLVSGFATDMGLVQLPYVFTWAYLLVGLAMSAQLASEVVRASVLSSEVQANEHRWRSLLENVQLLVAGVDRSGRIDYVNPFYSEVTGYSAEELLGRPLGEPFEAEFSAALAGDLQPRAERAIRTKEGGERQVVWSSVLLRDRTGEATGTLSIGADVTERRAAEQARDDAHEKTRAALAEVEELKRRLEDEVVYLESEIVTAGHFDEIVGESDALRYVLGKVEQVAPLDTTVLIEGETGVGKELFARAIHRRSPRARRPLVKVNCASLPENLVEDELFGHERGAFTGATRLRKGRFELADGGTIFLDEVGELPFELQGKLLRVLQEGEFERVGGDQTLKVDVRVLAATNRNLEEEVPAGRFREDLFFRLHVFPITVPALRQRQEDIPLLARAFVERYASAQGKRITTIPSAVVDELNRYDWPGNVRELENVIQRAVITSSGDTLRLAASLTRKTQGADGDESLELADVERRHITSVLVQCDWRIEGSRGAATVLGLHPNTLRFRMKKLGVTRPKATGR